MLLLLEEGRGTQKDARYDIQDKQAKTISMQVTGRGK